MSLRKDAESHIGLDDDFNDVFYHDIKVLDAVIAELRKKECRKPCKEEHHHSRSACPVCGNADLGKEKNFMHCPKCNGIFEKEENERNLRSTPLIAVVIRRTRLIPTR